MADNRGRVGVKIVDPTTDANEAGVDGSGNLAVILAANTGVDIGDVDVLTLPTSPDTIADDAAFTPATSPVFPLGAFADETAPDPVDEGDVGIVRMSLNRNMYTRIRDDAGNERGANVDASNNLNVILAANTGVDIGDVDVTSLPTSPDTVADDVAFIAASAVFPLGAHADDTAPDAVDEGDVGIVRMSLTRSLHVRIRDDAGNERGMNCDASGNANVILAANTGVDIGDVDVTSMPTGTSATEVQGTAADGATPVGDPVLMAGWDSTNVQTLATDASGNLQVDVLSGGGEPTPTNPTRDQATSAAVAAGSSANLDSAEISEAEKLWAVDIAASVPFKVQFQMVENGTPANLSPLLFGRANETLRYTLPHRDFATHAGASGGVDVFRAVVTNMDNTQAADVHAGFFYST